jgi:drug/metabolite transporter (DMT)-like permease
VAAGVASACVAGLAYSLQSGVLRKMATGPIPNSFTLLMLSGTGIVVLGAISLGRLGVEGLRSTRPDDLLIMIWGGLFNALAFFLLTKALELISMVMVNAITASQAAMAAVAGVLFFSESITWPLATGVGLTIAGLLLMDRRGHVAIDDAP